MQIVCMKFITFALIAISAVLSTSCGTIQQKDEYKGPVSSESTIPWNTRQPGEGQGLLGGLGQ